MPFNVAMTTGLCVPHDPERPREWMRIEAFGEAIFGSVMISWAVFIDSILMDFDLCVLRIYEFGKNFTLDTSTKPRPDLGLKTVQASKHYPYRWLDRT